MGIYIGKETGQLIKRYRLDLNMSQESLCKGICAISYLSKIESGTVSPSEEIIIQLFRTLNVDYIADETFISDSKSLFEKFYKDYFFGRFENANIHYNQLLEQESSYLHSPLMLDFLILKCYKIDFSMSFNDRKSILEELEQLSSHESSFSFAQLSKYLYIKLFLQISTKDYITASETASKFSTLEKSAPSLRLIGLLHFFRGEYLIATEINTEAFSLASDSGNLYLVKDISLMQAACYSNLKHPSLMLKYYERALNICESLNNTYDKELIYYNIGATYLTFKIYDKAKIYLLKSLDLTTSRLESLNAGKSDDTHNVSLYQKLSIVYFELGNFEQSHYYLGLAYTYFKCSEYQNPQIIQLTLDIIGLRLDDSNYLLNPTYLYSLETIYHGIGEELHFGFKQFYGDYLITCYKSNRRYKDALVITEELYTQSPIFPEIHL